MLKTIAKGTLAVCLVLILAGCATGASKAAAPKKLTPEDEVKAVLDGWKNALLAKDVDKAMTAYSDAYRGDNGSDKKGLTAQLARFREGGDLDGLTVGFAQMKVVIAGEKATASPIDLSNNRGSMSLSLTFAKEAGKWLIVGASEV